MDAPCELNAKILQRGQALAQSRKSGRVNDRKKTANDGNRFATLNAVIDLHMRLLSNAEFKCWMLLFRDTKRDGIASASHARTSVCANTRVHVLKCPITPLVRVI